MRPINFTQGHAMKTEWFVVNVTPVDSPDRAERAILGVILHVFLSNSGHLFGWEATLLCKSPFPNPNIFT